MDKNYVALYGSYSILTNDEYTRACTTRNYFHNTLPLDGKILYLDDIKKEDITAYNDLITPIYGTIPWNFNTHEIFWEYVDRKLSEENQGCVCRACTGSHYVINYD